MCETWNVEPGTINASPRLLKYPHYRRESQGGSRRFLLGVTVRSRLLNV